MKEILEKQGWTDLKGVQHSTFLHIGAQEVCPHRPDEAFPIRFLDDLTDFVERQPGSLLNGSGEGEAEAHVVGFDACQKLEDPHHLGEGNRKASDKFSS